MPLMSDRLLNTGEFARLCATTRETILHYDREGLLHPVRVTEKQYRKYSPLQYFDFETIALLRDAGLGLADIRRFLQQSDDPVSGTVLERCARTLDRRISHLEDCRRRLARLQSLHVQFRSMTPGRLQVRPDEAGPLPAVIDLLPLDAPMDVFSPQFAEFYARSTVRAKRGKGFSDGLVIALADARKGRFIARALFQPATPETPPERQHRFSSRMRAGLLCPGSDEEGRAALRAFVRELASRGLRCEGEAVYAVDFSPAVPPESPEECQVGFFAALLPADRTP